ncbi:MAG: oxidoreductase-like domain-containing protein [Pseudomonadota bacterium]
MNVLPAGTDDPAPIPPPQPGLDDCCRSGCVPCVFDLYEEAMDKYREQLKAWQARQTAPSARA